MSLDPAIGIYVARGRACREACADLSDAALAAGVVARMVALLRRLEWASMGEFEHYWNCPSCYVKQGYEHQPDCELAVLLALLGETADALTAAPTPPASEGAR